MNRINAKKNNKILADISVCNHALGSFIQCIFIRLVEFAFHFNFSPLFHLFCCCFVFDYFFVIFSDILHILYDVHAFSLSFSSFFYFSLHSFIVSVFLVGYSLNSKHSNVTCKLAQLVVYTNLKYRVLIFICVQT